MKEKNNMNLDDYWKGRGEIYYNEYYDQPKYELQRLKDQEDVLVNFLKGKKFDSILEVGCGFGRYTKIFSSLFNPDNYTALDISNVQIEKAKKFVNNKKIKFVTSRFQDYNSTEKFDLVFASEILMHINFSEINNFIKKLISSSKGKIVTIDWYEKELIGKEKGGYCFVHNYDKIFKRFGLKDVKIHMIPMSMKLKTINTFAKLRGRHGIGNQAITIANVCI